MLSTLQHSIDGILNLNKPRGKTSFQMVALIRKLSRVRKVGHSGTLDPDATGVLPILLGRATKLASFLTDSTKVYQANIEFGRTTNTYDSSGEVTQEFDISPLDLKGIEEALKGFRGVIEQVPPMYSAVKHGGKSLYRLARAGIEIPRSARMVTVFRIDILDWQNPVLTIEVECSKGTYIRSLAHDLGMATGYGAHQKELTRIKNGPFHIDDSVSISQLEEDFRRGDWERFVNPPDTVLSHLPAIVVNLRDEEAIVNGQPFSSADKYPAGQQCRAYSKDKKFLALARFEDGFWHPEKVFP